MTLPLPQPATVLTVTLPLSQPATVLTVTLPLSLSASRDLGPCGHDNAGGDNLARETKLGERQLGERETKLGEQFDKRDQVRRTTVWRDRVS